MTEGEMVGWHHCPSMEFSRQEYWSGVPLLVLEMSGAL